MADNYIERQQKSNTRPEKQAWKQAQKYGKKENDYQQSSQNGGSR